MDVAKGKKNSRPAGNRHGETVSKGEKDLSTEVSRAQWKNLKEI